MLMRPPWMPLLLLLMAALLGQPSDAYAQGRIALVIGNSAYTKVPSLPNPAHDARDVALALERLGFVVKSLIDADFDRMRRSLLEFGRAAPNAEMAVVYFAGHGVEIDGNNWLLPTDVELKYDTDASTEAIGLPSAIQAVAGARTLGLVILDACRNNPFKSSMRRSIPARTAQIFGLAPVEPASNVLVAYAARDGTVANDGGGRNSPYTTALLKHIETPGLEVDFLFRNVRDDVMTATGNEQQPFVYGSLSSEEIYFKALPAGETAADEMPADAAEIAWSFLQATDDALTLARFVDRFPASARVSDARMRIASLATTTPRGAGDDLMPIARPVVFTDTEFERVEKAVARRFTRDTPAIDVAWDIVRGTRDHVMIRRFVDRFPGRNRQIEADILLAALGQTPVSAHAGSRPAINVDEAVLTRAAADPDVQQCFRTNDQANDNCQRAFGRFSDISRFVEDNRFTVAFCQTLGSPGGCVPTVKTAWNFPHARSGGAPAGDAAGGADAAGRGLGSGTGNSSTGTSADGGHDGKGPGGPPGIASHHHEHRGNSHPTSADSKAAGGGTGIKIHGPKISSTAKVTGPPITSPSVKTPNVRVNPPRVNVRVPNIDIRVH